MSNRLPLNVRDLLHQRRVEGERIEFKAGWNPDAILRTLCAFANDFENLEWPEHFQHNEFAARRGAVLFLGRGGCAFRESGAEGDGAAGGNLKVAHPDFII